MKKWWLILVVTLLLTGCTSGGSEKPEAVDGGSEAPVAGVDKGSAREGLNGDDDIEMSFARIYEEIEQHEALLGVSFVAVIEDESRVREAVEDFAAIPGMEFILGIPEDHYIYQLNEEGHGYVVCAIAPAPQAETLAINAFNVFTGESEEVLYRMETSGPVLLLIPEDSGVPYAQAFSVGEEGAGEAYFEPHLSLRSGRLADSEFFEGVWDFTPEAAYNRDLPFYAQGAFDAISHQPVVQQALAEGLELIEVDEGFIASYPGIIFALVNPNTGEVQSYAAYEVKTGIMFYSEPGEYDQWVPLY